MDENNNMNQENGFVMRDNPASDTPSPDNAQQGGVQETAGGAQNEPEQDTTYRWSRPEKKETEENPDAFNGGTAQGQNTSYQMGGGSAQENQDQVYRFQNTPTSRPVKEKKATGMPKVIAGAVVFGVVAALCFAGVTALFQAITGGRSSSGGQIGSTGDSEPVTIVSGASVAAYDVSGIVDRVMPAIDKNILFRTSVFLDRGRLRIHRKAGCRPASDCYKQSRGGKCRRDFCPV